MTTINLSNIPQKRRRTGFTGYLDDFGVTVRIWWWQIKQHPILVFLAVVGFVAILSIFVQRRTAPPVPVQTVATVVVVATPTAAVGQASERAPGLYLDRAVIAYDAPGGVALDALEPGRAYTVLATSGRDWTQIDAGSGPVWVQSNKLPGYGPDIATSVPTATPRTEYVAVSNPVAAAAQAQPVPTAAPATPVDAGPAFVPMPTAAPLDSPEFAAQVQQTQDDCTGKEKRDDHGNVYVCVATVASDGSIWRTWKTK